MRLLDLLADRSLGLFDLESCLLLRLADLDLRALLLHPGGLLGLGDLQVCRSADFVPVHVEEHAHAVPVSSGAVDQIDVRPALGAVRLLHLEHPQIRIFGDHIQMRLCEPLSRNARHLKPVEGILRDRLRKARHAHVEFLRELPAHIDGMPVSGLPCQNTERPRNPPQDLRCRRDALLHLGVELVEARRLLEYAVIYGVVTFLVSRSADHAVLEAVPVPPEESQIYSNMTVSSLDLFQSGHYFVTFFLGDHEEGVPLHLFAELVFLIMELLPKILIIKESLRALFLHICKDQHAARQVLSELPDLFHSSDALFLGHMKECDLKVLPALTDRHAAAKIDGFLLLLGHEVDLVCYRRNVSGTG